MLLVAGPAAGDGGEPGFAGENTGDQTVIEGTAPGGSSGGGGSGGSGGSGGPGGPAYSGPWTQERWVIACFYNGPDNPDDVLCTGAFTCPDERAIRYRVYTRLMSAAGEPLTGWTFSRTACRGPGEVEEGVQEPVVTTEDVMDVARTSAPPPTIGAEPGARTYVNVPTNFHASTDDTTLTVVVLGQSIAVSYAVTGVTWDFGDGATGSGAGVAGARVGQAGAVEHQYRRSADVEVTATATYTVSFTLPSGQQVTVPGQVQGTSDPLPLEVGEIQTTVTRVG